MSIKSVTRKFSDHYLAKKEADKVSYIWDRLIETFTNHMLNGTTIVYSATPFE
jgi:hypothetical protein